MYKFGQIEITSKDFNSLYQIANDADCEKIRVSEGVVANKHDTRYMIGYEVETGKIVPLCIKTCLLYTSPSPRDGLLSRMPSSA